MTDSMIELYNKKFDITNMDTDSIVCSNWAQIYSDLAQAAGVDAERINIMGGKRLGTHKYVTVDLGKDKLLVADATTNMFSVPDLVKVKFGGNTSGFMIKTKKEFNEIMGEYSTNAGLTMLSVRTDKKAKANLAKIDDKIGYSENKFQKDLDDLSKFYKSSSVNSISLEDKVNAFINLFDDKRLGAIDAYSMMQIYADNFFGDQIDTKYSIINGNVLDTVEIPLEDGNSLYIYKVNSEPIKTTNDIKSVIIGLKK